MVNGVVKVMFLLALTGTAYAADEPTAATPSPTTTPAAKQAKKLPFVKDDSDFGKLPTFVKSTSLTLEGEQRIFHYDGNVEVRQGDMTLTATTIDGKYSQNNQIEQLVAHDNVVIVKGDTVRASGERATYDNAAQTIVLTENPELQQNGSILTADSITIFLKDNRSVAQGTVRVKLVNNKQDNQQGNFPGMKKK